MPKPRKPQVSLEATPYLHIPAHREHSFRTNVNTDSGST
jgi:hypothetical protein